MSPVRTVRRHISPDYHEQVVACCRANGFAPTVTNTAHSIVSQLAMVACGIGVALVPETAAEHALGPHEGVRFMRIRAATIHLAAVCRTDRATQQSPRSWAQHGTKWVDRMGQVCP